jgi:phosphatidylglycerol---prolipoprotein diacylglyceryl transferase
MNFPIDFHVGSLVIPSHFIFEFLAFTFGYWYYRYLKKRSSHVLSEETEWVALAGMIIGAFVGSRLIAALENPELFFHPVSWLYYFGSQTVAGALVGGVIGIEISKKISGIRIRTGDFFVFPLILGIMIGRVGCFLTGVRDGTVGLPSDLPWAFDQGDGIPRHSTNMYEILLLIVFFITLRLVQKHFAKKLRQGDLFRIFIIGYGTFRYFVEFIKPITPIIFGLSSIQIACALIVIYYLISFVIRIFDQKRYHDKFRHNHIHS